MRDPAPHPAELAGGLLRLPGEIAFGSGVLDSLGRHVSALGREALVVTDANIASTPGFARALALLAAAGVKARVFDATPPDIPPEAVAACVDVARGGAIDVVVGFGGGSSLDVAKVTALLLTHGGPLERYYGERAVPGPLLPVVAVPTTSGTGSEVTPVAVVSDPGRRLKVGVSDPHLVPRVALCDPDLTLSCPPTVTAHAGIDALMHAVEAYLAPPRPPVWDAVDDEVFRGASSLTAPFALAAIEQIAGTLERAVADGGDADARARMQYASLCAGIAFGHAGTAGAHALQYAVGAATGTPHGLGVGLLAPYVLACVRPAAVAPLARVARALGVAAPGADLAVAADAAVAEIARLAAAVGIPPSLRALGVAREQLGQLADDAATVTRLLKNSPRPLDRDLLFDILDAAWSGSRTDWSHR
jgi:alcohol dehydrogenase class IV